MSNLPVFGVLLLATLVLAAATWLSLGYFWQVVLQSGSSIVAAYLTALTLAFLGWLAKIVEQAADLCGDLTYE